ncbi:hypothetical protein KC926_01675 [Candidatus Kaiserbacteria bacterium]|nr:hypothetical protein [Candidatus Kaiserbacteria bacterium]
MEGVLSSVKNMSIILTLIFSIFVFFPQNYFKRYMKVWFWWLFIMSFSITLASKPVGDSIGSLDRSQVVIVLGVLGLIQALFFIYKSRSKVD